MSDNDEVTELASDILVPRTPLQPADAFALAEHLVNEGWEKR